MICFQISIFEPLNTARCDKSNNNTQLWFAFKLVSLSHWIQQIMAVVRTLGVVICFQISIFEPLNTAWKIKRNFGIMLWFAFKLVSLSHWIQLVSIIHQISTVVICFQISIFEPLNTAIFTFTNRFNTLWFAFKLVSLSHWIQRQRDEVTIVRSCDLLSN